MLFVNIVMDGTIFSKLCEEIVQAAKFVCIKLKSETASTIDTS